MNCQNHKPFILFSTNILIVFLLGCSASLVNEPSTTIATKTSTLPVSTTNPSTAATSTINIPLTPTPTSTPKPQPSETPQPEASYNCPANPDASNISNLSLAEDIQSGKLSEWVMSHANLVNQPMSINPSALNYRVNHLNSDGTNNLGAFGAEPNFVAKHSQFFGLCKINPKEFGYEGKSDVFLLITILQDKNDRRMAQFTFATKAYIHELLKYDAVEPGDSDSSYADRVYISEGAKPGGPDDLRVMEKGKAFMESQGTSLEEVNKIFKEISDTDMFSDVVVNFFSRTVFYSAPSRNYRP
jgi:hypothetical protein